MNASQSAKLKEYGKSGELTLAMVKLILTEEKPKERKVTIKDDKINRYFPERNRKREYSNARNDKINRYFLEDYSNDDIENIIIGLLEEWQKKQ